MLVYHPYSAHVTVDAGDGAPRARSVFDRDLDARFSRRALVFPLAADGAFDLDVEGARDDRPVALTVSIGEAECMADDTPASLIGVADQAMYAAKRAGRNLVVVGRAAGVATSPGV